MKKYLLTALLWVFAFIGFASADTVWNFSSSSSICQKSSSDLFGDNIFFDELVVCEGEIDLDSNIYFCISTDNVPYTQTLITSETHIDVENYCFSSPMYDGWGWGNMVYSDENPSNAIDWYFYFSNSPITYSSSSAWWNSSNSSNTPLLSGWISQLTPVVTGIKWVVVEFIPYVVYISIWILLATLWFIVVKRLMNWMSRKITWTFSSRRSK